LIYPAVHLHKTSEELHSLRIHQKAIQIFESQTNAQYGSTEISSLHTKEINT